MKANIVVFPYSDHDRALKLLDALDKSVWGYEGGCHRRGCFSWWWLLPVGDVRDEIGQKSTRRRQTMAASEKIRVRRVRITL